MPEYKSAVVDPLPSPINNNVDIPELKTYPVSDNGIVSFVSSIMGNISDMLALLRRNAWYIIFAFIVVRYIYFNYIKPALQSRYQTQSLKEASHPKRVGILEHDMKRVRLRQQIEAEKKALEFAALNKEKERAKKLGERKKNLTPTEIKHFSSKGHRLGGDDHNISEKEMESNICQMNNDDSGDDNPWAEGGAKKKNTTSTTTKKKKKSTNTTTSTRLNRRTDYNPLLPNSSSGGPSYRPARRSRRGG